MTAPHPHHHHHHLPDTDPAAAAAGWAGRSRRRLAVVCGWLLWGVLWWTAGTPWRPPAAAFGVVLLVRAMGRLLPRTLRRPLLAGAVAAAAVLVPALSVGAVLLAAAGVLATVAVHRGTLGALASAAGVRAAGVGGVGVGGVGASRNRAWVVVAVALALAFCGTAVLVVEHLYAQRQQSVQVGQASEFHRAQLLPASPARAARLLLRAVADDDPTVCTTLLSPAAAAQLAMAAGAPDCPTALRALAGRVGQPARYPAPDADATPTSLASNGELGTADLCHLTWNGVTALLTGTPRGTSPTGAPGPQLGRLVLTRVLGQGYQITQFTPC
jgi:hypothetical protein